MKNVEVVTAVNGDLALRQIQKNMGEFYNYNNSKKRHTKEQPVHYDAIIMDLSMPIMDGQEACMRIQQIYKEFNEKQICLKESLTDIEVDNL